MMSPAQQSDCARAIRIAAARFGSRQGAVVERADLHQAGWVAVLEAARHHRQDGAALAKYAQKRIRGAMVECLMAGCLIQAKDRQAGAALRFDRSVVRLNGEDVPARPDIEAAEQPDLTAAIVRLGARQRAMIEAMYFTEPMRAISEIAAENGITANTARQAHWQALKRLRRTLAQK